MAETRRAGRVDTVGYFAARFIGQAGQNLFLAALLVAASTSDSAALGLSGMFIATLLPAIVFGLPGGAIADRLGPGVGYAAGSLLRLAPIALGVVILDGPASVFLLAALYSSGSQVYTPAEMAMVRSVQPNAAGRAHSFLIALQYGGQGFGMLVLGPALYFAQGPQLMMFGAAVAFAILAVLTATLAFRLRDTTAAVKIPGRHSFSFRETFDYYRSEPRAGYAVGLLGFKAVAAKSMVIALPFYLEKDMGLGEEAVVFLLMPGIAGVLLGLIWAGRTLSLATAPQAMRLALIGIVVSVFALAALDYGLTTVAQWSNVPPIVRLEASMNTTFAAALPVAFLLGLCFAGALVSGRMILTQTAPIGQQARVFATQLTVTEAVLVLPLALAGVGTEFAGARVALLTLGVVGVGLILFLEGLAAAHRTRAARTPMVETPDIQASAPAAS